MPLEMSFVKSDARRKELSAKFGANAWAPPSPATARRTLRTAQPFLTGCRVCGAEDAEYFFRDRRFCRAHCPWKALIASSSEPPPPAAPVIMHAPKRRRIVPTADELLPPSPTSVVSAAITPAITPSGSDAKMSDLDEEVSAVSISPPPSPTLARGKRLATAAPGFPPGFDARAVRLVG